MGSRSKALCRLTVQQNWLQAGLSRRGENPGTRNRLLGHGVLLSNQVEMKRDVSSSGDDISPNDVCIVAASRTPIGGFQGSLASFTAPQLGSIVLKDVLRRSGVDGSLVEEVFMGNVLSAGLGQAPSRQAVLGAGMPYSVTCTDVNKVCASGMKAVMLGAQSIQLGQSRIVLSGGMESMSNVPYYMPKARTGYRLGNAELVDGLIKDGLWDPYGNVHMGNCAEKCAGHFEFSREQQDDHAIRSWERAKSAADNGFWENEIVPVTVLGRSGSPDTVVATDDALSKMDPERLRALRPVFVDGGTITAGNASPISDGASALALASGASARELGLKVLARVRGYGDASQAPEWFTTTPALAIKKALYQAKLDITDVDYFEINEAFSVVDLANQHLLSLDSERVNAHGGAVALGHPIGCSGARILVTLLHVLQHHGGRIGVASICNGGGGASAVVIENCT